MERLGYARYGAGGGDWGAIITTELARADNGRHLCGLHLTMPLGEPPYDTGSEVLSEADRRGLEDWAAHQANGTVVHVPINSTRPHTLAFALNDSPAGLAAWLVDKYRSYSDCDGDVENSFTKDELLAEITTYWVTGTIASASRLYYERAHEGASPSPRRDASRSRPAAPSFLAMCAVYPGRGPSATTTSSGGRRCPQEDTSQGWKSLSSWSPSFAPSSALCADHRSVDAYSVTLATIRASTTNRRHYSLLPAPPTAGRATKLGPRRPSRVVVGCWGQC